MTRNFFVLFTLLFSLSSFASYPFPKANLRCEIQQGNGCESKEGTCFKDLKILVELNPNSFAKLNFKSRNNQLTDSPMVEYTFATSNVAIDGVMQDGGRLVSINWDEHHINASLLELRYPLWLGSITIDGHQLDISCTQ